MAAAPSQPGYRESSEARRYEPTAGHAGGSYSRYDSANGGDVHGRSFVNVSQDARMMSPGSVQAQVNAAKYQAQVEAKDQMLLLAEKQQGYLSAAYQQSIELSLKANAQIVASSEAEHERLMRSEEWRFQTRAFEAHDQPTSIQRDMFMAMNHSRVSSSSGSEFHRNTGPQQMLDVEPQHKPGSLAINSTGTKIFVFYY